MAASSLTAFGTVFPNRAYRGPVAVFAFSFGVMMSYISASPFVYQHVVGLNEVGYGLAFGVNAVGAHHGRRGASRLVGRCRRRDWSRPRSPCR